jgi:hypothetical protein
MPPVKFLCRIGKIGREYSKRIIKSSRHKKTDSVKSVFLADSRLKPTNLIDIWVRRAIEPISDLGVTVS